MPSLTAISTSPWPITVLLLAVTLLLWRRFFASPYPAWPFEPKIIRHWETRGTASDRVLELLLADTHHISTGCLPCICLSGPGGSGKTNSLRRVFDDPKVTKAYRDRRFYLDFSEASDFTDVVESALASLRAAPAGSHTIDAEHHVFDRFLERLDALAGSHQILLVFDGMEQVWMKDHQLFDKLIEVCNPTTPERRHSVILGSRIRLWPRDDDSAQHVFMNQYPCHGEWIIRQACSDAGPAISAKAYNGGSVYQEIPMAEALAQHVAYNALACRLLAVRAIECGGDLKQVMRRLRTEGISYISLPEKDRTGSRCDSLTACLESTWNEPRVNAAHHNMMIERARVAVGHIKLAAHTPDPSVLETVFNAGFLWPGYKPGWALGRRGAYYNQSCPASSLLRPLHPLFSLYALGKWKEMEEDRRKAEEERRKGKRD